ncbi:MAG: BatB protein [Bacteroidetes bacterium SW_11_45_7]|nr:MAG: BatB protein [Bacteroidetes bacterium SW_11_45_7]
MLKFAHNEYFYLLLALVPLILAFIAYIIWRKRALRSFGETALVNRLTPAKPVYKHQIKFVLIALAIVFLSIGLANPQIGTEYKEVKRKGVDLVIALDVSQSMLAEDIKPDRLTRSKRFVSRLFDNLANDRVALSIFAGNAYLQMPLTVDYAAGELFLNSINTDIVPQQGTAIGDAIDLALQSFDNTEQKYRTIVLISDGEDHQGDAQKMARKAAEKGATIFTIGVGSEEGAPIPVKGSGRQEDYKRDDEGNIVLSRLNQYFRLGAGNQPLEGLMNEIASLEKQEFEERVFTDFEDQFQYFLLVGFVLLFIEFLISERKSQVFSDWKVFR